MIVLLDTASSLSELKEKSDRRTDVEMEKKHTVNLSMSSTCTFLERVGLEGGSSCIG